MAEGHQAVAFSFAITHEGLDVNFDFEVPHWNDVAIWLHGCLKTCVDFPYRLLDLLPEVLYALGGRGAHAFRYWNSESLLVFPF